MQSTHNWCVVSNRHVLFLSTNWCVLSSSVLMQSTHNWCVVSNRHVLFLSTNWCVLSSSMLMQSTHNWCAVSNRHMLFLSTNNLCVLSSSTCCWLVHRNEKLHYYSVYAEWALDSWHRQQSLLFSKTFHLWDPSSLQFKGYQGSFPGVK